MDDFDFDVSDRFTYEYNFYDSWLHDIRIEAIEKPFSLKKAPRCLSGNGMPGVNQYEAYEKMIDLVKIIVDSDTDESITVGDVRRRIEALYAVRFNHKNMNRKLAKLNLEDEELAIEHMLMAG